jgi:hypothetical protein
MDSQNSGRRTLLRRLSLGFLKSQPRSTLEDDNHWHRDVDLDGLGSPTVSVLAAIRWSEDHVPGTSRSAAVYEGSDIYSPSAPPNNGVARRRADNRERSGHLRRATSLDSRVNHPPSLLSLPQTPSYRHSGLPPPERQSFGMRPRSKLPSASFPASMPRA